MNSLERHLRSEMLLGNTNRFEMETFLSRGQLTAVVGTRNDKGERKGEMEVAIDGDKVELLRAKFGIQKREAVRHIRVVNGKVLISYEDGRTVEQQKAGTFGFELEVA